MSVWNIRNATDGTVDFVSVETTAESIASMAAEKSVSTLKCIHYCNVVAIPIHLTKESLYREADRQLRTVLLTLWIIEAEIAGPHTLVTVVMAVAETHGINMAFPRLIKGQLSHHSRGDKLAVGKFRKDPWALMSVVTTIVTN